MGKVLSLNPSIAALRAGETPAWAGKAGFGGRPAYAGRESFVVAGSQGLAKRLKVACGAESTRPDQNLAKNHLANPSIRIPPSTGRWSQE